MNTERKAVIERRVRVVAMTREGQSASEIAVALGITARSVVRIRHTSGIAQPPPSPLTEKELRTAAGLLADGCSYQEVARTIGRSAAAVRRHFPGYGWSSSEGGHIGCMNRWANERMKAVAV